MSEEEKVDEREERRQEWINILKECAIYHSTRAKELKSPIIGAEDSQECIMHQVWRLSIMDAVGLIELLPLIDKDNEAKDEATLPQHHPGPSG